MAAASTRLPVASREISQRAEDRHAVVQQRAQHAAEAGDGQPQEDRPGQRQAEPARGRATSGRRRCAASAGIHQPPPTSAASTSSPQCRSKALVASSHSVSSGQFAPLAEPANSSLNFGTKKTTSTMTTMIVPTTARKAG